MRRALVTLLLGVAVAAPPASAAEPAIVSDERGQTWRAAIERNVGVRVKPDRRARELGRLVPFSYYGVRDVVVVLRAREGWSKVRYAGLGRRVGWVPSYTLAEPRLTRTWVSIDRGRKLLKAYVGKRRVLSARVGVGAPGSPTPGGRFFVRERLVPSNKRGIYGPLAFGLSAYSRYRTDWPGGGQVGIHGTNQPRLIPGRISNGCVRLRNADVRRLGRIVKSGTPVHIR